MAYSTIDKSSLYQNNVLYTGTGQGGSDRQITGVGFQPDMVWIKNRSASQEHVLVDAVRGATKSLTPDEGVVEATNDIRVGAFISDGFQLGSGDVQNRVNGDGNGMVAWNWKANGSGSANTDGSISSTVSVNTTAGFSIVKWTGTAALATIGHGLGVAPRFIMIKDMEQADNWNCYHASLGNDSHMHINLNNAASGSSTYWQDTDPTSSVFSIGSTNDINYSGHDFIAYCFAEKAGYSKFSSFSGNGSIDGPFLYTGFKPSFALIKNTISASDWNIYDNKRSTSGGYNESDYSLVGNTDAAEDTSTSYNDIDMLCNGIKIREDNGDCNGSGQKLIYVAFGQPVISNGGTTATAR